ncbi:M20/M25/M40 family metallo-hydrolase [Patescibacteria group bacterium]|nr:M20/M25/M40 family metallo-hydrolase [Patescibacteria group bacterium]MCL5091649.1 M20/M25/M40 family metallo-hydrolase [Patescibacteria group bacterium]
MENPVALFQRLVKISSPSGKEQEMRAYLRTRMKQLGLPTRIDQTGNLFAYRRGPGDPLLIATHMDTVQPGVGIKPQVKNQVIKSDGRTILGADNKAAVAAVLAALSAGLPHRALELVFSVREETDMGMSRFPFSWLKSKRGLVFDFSQPVGGIVLRSPHIINFQVKITGKAAHSSRPDRGINALSYALQLINQLKTGAFDQGETTINVGTIQGGTGINTIPETVQYAGEIRSYNRALFTKHLNQIRRLHQATGLPVLINWSTNGASAGYVHRLTDPWVKAVTRLISGLKIKTNYYHYSAVSDANVLNDHGIKTINIADGTRFTHTVNECISVADLKQLTAIVKTAVATL